jgi:hypothetical protein
MAEPIKLADGTQITNWDKDMIEVSGPRGGMTIPRALAPAELRSQVDAADQQVAQRNAYAGISTAPADARPIIYAPGVGTPADAGAPANPYGVVTEPAGVAAAPAHANVTTPTMGQPRQAGAAAAAPAANAQQAAAPNDLVGDVQGEIARLRGMPQTETSGGGYHAVPRVTGSDRAKLNEQQGVIDSASTQRQDAALDAGEAGAMAAGDVERIHGDEARQIEGRQKEQEQDFQAYQQRYAAEETKLGQLEQAAKQEIDPKRFWKNKSTGDKILAAISLALGGFVNGYSQGRVQNTPLQMIQSAIQDDIDSQKENRNSAERAAVRQGTLLERVRGQYDHDDKAKEATFILGLDAQAKRVEGIAAHLQSEEAKAKATDLVAQIREEAASRKQAFIAQTADAVLATPGGVKATDAKLRADALENATYLPFNAKAFIPAAERVTGVPMQAINEEDAKAINTKMAGVEEIMRKTKAIQDIAAKGGKLSPQAKTDVKSLYASIALDVKNAESAGALDEGTVRIVSDIIGPNPTDLTTMTTAIPRVQESLRAGARAALRNRAAPVNPERVPLTMRSQYAPSGAQPLAAPKTEPLTDGGS